MIPARFDYEVADSVDDAIQLLQSKDDPKLLAGGHSLLPLMKLRLARPATLIDVGRISSLRGVRDGGDHLVVGALTRHHELEHDPLARQHIPLLAYTASLVGDRQVRHMGTIGGSLAHGDPASDLPTVCLALDATLVARGPNGERTIAAKDFFQGFFDTALAPNEVLTEVRVPKTGSAGWSYLKFRQRSLDWPTVGVAALVTKQNGGVGQARIGLANMGQTPLRATAAEKELAGKSAGAIEAAAGWATEGTDPPTDTWGTAEFRRHLARVLVGRAVNEALAR
jgi:aerobic carbon-monoxide dehydrogenase medium subunit